MQQFRACTLSRVAMAAVVGLLALLPTARAALITQSSVGDSFTVNWLLEDGATDPNGNTNNTGQDISAEALFQLTAFNVVENFIDLLITATNTTAANDDEVGLWKIGFGTDPDATGVTFFDISDGEFVDATLGSFPAFPNSAIIDITTDTDPGAPSNLQAGESDTFGLRVAFADLTAASTITLDPFDAFFQSDPDSFQVSSGNGNGNDVPEPATIGLLGAGLLILGLLTWRGGRREI